MTQDKASIAVTAHLWLPYTQMRTAPPPPMAVRTKGSRIILSDGRSLIDGVASWWTACHGYNNPHIRDAVKRQLQDMPHVMLGGLVHPAAVTLAKRLANLLPGDLDHVFFSDSGSVSVEIALKMAMQYWRNRGETRATIVGFSGGYHGDTTGAMAVSDPATGLHRMFAGLLPAQMILDLPRTEDGFATFARTLERHAKDIAAIIVEPLVQGAGGMIFHEPWLLRRLRAAADRYGLLLIFDEIFTGFGRTGAMFACEGAGVIPDIVTLSKALTGGTLPLAATVARHHVYDAFLSHDPQHAFMHGPTFMANALACAAANASLDLFQSEPRLDQVKAIEASLTTGLAPCRGRRGVMDVRVRGAIGVVQMERIRDVARLRARFIEKGVFVRPFGNVIYLTPALTITARELAILTRAVVEAVSEGV